MKSFRSIQVYVLLITLVSILFCGCKKDDTPIFAFSSMWTGTYIGTGDNGTWHVTINSQGEVSGSAHSDVFYESYKLTGNMKSNGQFYATFGSTSLGGSFTGQALDNNINGTWANNHLKIYGTWSGSKV
jgi:hypothetical protein